MSHQQDTELIPSSLSARKTQKEKHLYLSRSSWADTKSPSHCLDPILWRASGNTVSKNSPTIRPSTGTRQKHPDETHWNWSFQSVHKHRCFDKYVLQLAKLFHLPSVSLDPELLPYCFLRPRPLGRNRREAARGAQQSLLVNPPRVRAHKARGVCCLMLWVYVSAFGSGTKPWEQSGGIHMFCCLLWLLSKQPKPCVLFTEICLHGIFLKRVTMKIPAI